MTEGEGDEPEAAGPLIEAEGDEADSTRLAIESEAQSHEAALADVPSSPTWPIVESDREDAPPPVGLNWGTVAGVLGADLRILQHEGLIILAGEYFPDAGVFIDPESFQGQPVDVGELALRHGYFLGNLTLREFGERIPPAPPRARTGWPVARTEGAPIIGLFRAARQAQRARTAILRGAVGAGVSQGDGPLGIELRVSRSETPGDVASIITANGGAVISIGGRPVAGASAQQGPLSTAPEVPDGAADAPRPGTGVSSDSQAPQGGPGGSDEFNRL